MRPRRARPGNRAGRGPALAPDPKVARRLDGRNLHPPVAHIVPNARSETKKTMSPDTNRHGTGYFHATATRQTDRIPQGAANPY